MRGREGGNFLPGWGGGFASGPALGAVPTPGRSVPAAGRGAAGRGGAGGAGPPVTARPRRTPGSPGGASAVPPAVSVRRRGRRADCRRFRVVRGAVVGWGGQRHRPSGGRAGPGAAAPRGERGDGAELRSLGAAAGLGGRHGAVSGEGRGGKGLRCGHGGRGSGRAVGKGLGCRVGTGWAEGSLCRGSDALLLAFGFVSPGFCSP